MTFHTHRTPLPAAVPPAAKGLPGSVTRALARLSRTVALPKAEKPQHNLPTLLDALASLRAADLGFDRNPELRALRKALAGRVRERLAGVEADIAALDMLGGDPDLEETGDTEPSLCGIGGHEPFGHMPSMAPGGCNYGAHPYDVEHDDADGPEGDDERDGSWPSENQDDEPSLGSLAGTADGLDAGQVNWSSGGVNDLERDDSDKEPSLGSLGGTADGADQPQTGWSEGDAADKEVSAPTPVHRAELMHREPGSALAEARDRARRLRYGRRPTIAGFDASRLVVLPIGGR